MEAGMLSGARIFISSVLTFGCLSAQSAVQTVSDNHAATPAIQPTREPSRPAALTPEMRGDIFMARKMYREAIEAYGEGPKDSAVLANKTGIAFHQMMNLQEARRLYEHAIKLEPRYSEAVNNLGTI